MRLSGTLIHYYVHCPRQAWLFARGVTPERENERVQLGALVHETSYSRERHEEFLADGMRLDWVDGAQKVVHEIKLSRGQERGHRLQLLHYLLELKEMGAGIFEGELNYPTQRRRTKVVLDEQAEAEVRETRDHIQALSAGPCPPALNNKKACGPCSYVEFCYS